VELSNFIYVIANGWRSQSEPNLDGSDVCVPNELRQLQQPGVVRVAVTGELLL